MKKQAILLSMLLLAAVLISSCAHRDCQGRKKTAKTDMGGWL
jgi:ABC-type Fe3+-citrate transport system substrate-binding protein